MGRCLVVKFGWEDVGWEDVWWENLVGKMSGGKIWMGRCMVVKFEWEDVRWGEVWWENLGWKMPGGKIYGGEPSVGVPSFNPLVRSIKDIATYNKYGIIKQTIRIRLFS